MPPDRGVSNSTAHLAACAPLRKAQHLAPDPHPAQKLRNLRSRRSFLDWTSDSMYTFVHRSTTGTSPLARKKNSALEQGHVSSPRLDIWQRVRLHVQLNDRLLAPPLHPPEKLRVFHSDRGCRNTRQVRRPCMWSLQSERRNGPHQRCHPPRFC